MRSILAVGAHPDDIELGCAATLLAHRAAGDHVTMLVLTGGENGPGDIGASIRRTEAEAAAAVLGVDLRWGGRRDCELTADAPMIGLIEKVLADTGADTVYVHAPNDTHQDHRAAAAATLSAARHLSRILHYQSPSTLSFDPTVFVDVAAYLDGKLAALSCHVSQVELSAMVDPEAVQASARYWGAQARVRYAEAFAPTRIVISGFPATTSEQAAHRSGRTSA